MATETYSSSSTSERAEDTSIGARFGLSNSGNVSLEDLKAMFNDEKADKEVAPTPTSDSKVSADLGETALSTSTQPDALETVPIQKIPESKEVADHGRHDSSRKHASEVHEVHDLRGQGLTAIAARVKSATERIAAKIPISVKVQKQESTDVLLARPDGHLGIEDTVQKPAEPEVPKEPKQPKQPTQHQEFVKKYEELWGANDKIKPEDIPEGELTYEQYLERRPKAQEGDAFHTGNRAFAVIDGKTRPIKFQAYENSLQAGNSQAHYDKSNEIVQKQTSDIIQQDVEGQAIVSNSEQLGALLALGNELSELKKSGATQSNINAKQRMFDDLKEFYKSKDIDERGLAFIDRKLSDSASGVKGYAARNGEKLTITNVSDVDGEKLYDVAHADGSEERGVASQDIAFERERDKEVLNTFDKVKIWFKKERWKYQKFGGVAYFSGKFSEAQQATKNAYNNVLNSGVEDTMAPNEKHRRRNINRVVLIAGAAVLAAAAVAYGIDQFGPSDASAQDIQPNTDANLGTGAGISEEMKDVLDGTTPTGEAPSTDAVEPLPFIDTTPDAQLQTPDTSGGYAPMSFEVNASGEKLADSLGISHTTWYNNEQELLKLDSNKFYTMLDGHIGLHPGQPSQAAQNFINSLRGR